MREALSIKYKENYMENNIALFNAAMIGENPDSAFIIEDNYLHAVDPSIANRQKEKCDPKKIISSMRNALKAIIHFSSGIVESHFLEIDWKMLEGKQNEEQEIRHKILNIYSHLPHHYRNELSTFIHHKH